VERQIMSCVPPSSSILHEVETGAVYAMVPMWLFWLQIAENNAQVAHDSVVPTAVLNRHGIGL
jgi:hypothetical protein